MDKMEKELASAVAALPRNRRYNLSPAQRTCLSELSTRDDLIVYPTDKNLGPSVADRRQYIQQVLSEHLTVRENYEPLTPTEAKAELDTQRKNFLHIHETWNKTLQTEAEATYFKRALSPEYLADTRTPQFYGAFKVHKNGAPKLRPIISSVNSISEIFSKWVDYQLKKVVKDLVPTYIKDSDQLIKELTAAFPNGLPPGAKLFSVDAVGMYSNIETDHGIDVIRQWLTQHTAHLPDGFPTEFVLAALEEIMKNNIFQFGDTFWRQVNGCAMGTSTAVNYAILYVGLLEIKRLLRNHRASLLFFKRFIDDGIGIWLPQKNENADETWNNFFQDLNDWGNLRWTCDGHGEDLIFLDLSISIDPNRNLRFKTYQKELNLYLYIPPMSAHSDSTLRSLIFGRLRAYKLHNTSPDDFLHFAKLLAQRLAARGWPMSTLLPLFTDACQTLDRQENPETSRHRAKLLDTERTADQAATKPFIFHLPYHPRGIQRQTIRRIFNETLADHLPDKTLIVAVSRPRNLRDRVCSTRLKDVPGENPSNILSEQHGGDQPPSSPLFDEV